jgi:hypothetical protein
MSQTLPDAAIVEEYDARRTVSPRQRLFLIYLLGTLIDLLVLNIFAEHWEHVVSASFTVSLFVAIMLQVMLKLTLVLEHRVAAYFNSKREAWGKSATFLRFFSAWLILFLSKFVILGAVDIAFGFSIDFTGPLHGVVAFIVVVVVMVLAEEAIVRLFRQLA